MMAGDIFPNSQVQALWSPGPNGGSVPAAPETPGTPVGAQGGGVDVPGSPGDYPPDYQAIAAANGAPPAFHLAPPPAQPNFGAAAQVVIAPGAGSPVNPNHIPGANGFGAGRTLQF